MLTVKRTRRNFKGVTTQRMPNKSQRNKNKKDKGTQRSSKKSLKEILKPVMIIYLSSSLYELNSQLSNQLGKI